MFEFKLALKYLMKNKKESILIIACIVVAITLILGVDIGSNSIQLNQIDMAREIAGYYDGTLKTNSKGNIEKLKQINGVYNVNTVKDLGQFIPKDGLISKLYTYNENYLKALNYKLVSGRLPKNEGEIVVDKKIFEKSNEGNILNKSIYATSKIDYKVNGENKVYSEKNKYKVVGVISKEEQYYTTGNEEGMGGAELLTFVNINESSIPKDLLNYDTVFNLKGVTQENLVEKFSKLREDYNPKLDSSVDIRQDTRSGISSNEYLDSTLRLFKDQQNNNQVQSKVFIIIIAAFTILNFFNIILTKLITQIGYLRIVGMSNKKVIKFYLIQIFTLFAVGSIMGFISSIIFARYAMSTILTINMFDISDFSKVKLNIPYFIVFKALAIVLFILLITVLIPVLKSLKKYPIDIINNTDKIRFKTKYNRKITKTLLKNNLLRNKIKTLVSIVVISFSGIMIIDKIDTNLDYIEKQTNKYSSYAPHKFNYFIRPEYNTSENIEKVSDTDISKIKNIDGVKDLKVQNYTRGILIIEKDKVNKLYMDDYGDKDSSLNTQDVYSVIEGIKDIDKLNEFVKEGNIKSLNDSKGDYINIAVCNNFYYMKGANYKYAIKDLKLGDILNFKVIITDTEGNYHYKNFKFRVSVILDEDYSINNEMNYTGVRALMNFDNLNKITNGFYNQEVFFNSKEESYKTINKLLENIQEKNKYLHVYDGQDHKLEFRITFPMIISLLVFVSALFNMYMTISLNISNNLREFSILRAIGLNKKSLKKLVVWESISYALLGSLLATIVIAIKQLKYIKYIKEVFIKQAGMDIKIKSIYMPPKEAIIFMVIIILFAFLVGYIKAKSIDKINIIDGINEN
ncbi:FtsX-like permease family protein [Paraclostridium sordellii]|uniref:FtsX-like permease family protein n=1 Tax=Paraclostridium sordellii TaxID=1505 RepID=UPI0005DBB454|nr:FtsX-like permease family protein [Paeniclostridium sordellii]CEN81320.1 ABC transporter permease [[Clostridium] sordellii] [Paeniclostridium sordellii]CEQ20195.1 ABC transporter permease [[Clostridium] sordellii] [Paeniclostridium sordellii]